MENANTHLLPVSVISSCRNNLNEIKSLVQQLSDDQYIRPIVLFDDSTIGQHVRHIIEFYQCLIAGAATGLVSYDSRKRDRRIETDRYYAMYCMDKIGSNMNIPDLNTSLRFEANYSPEREGSLRVETTWCRELAVCLEHSIHHQALIKIGLKELEMDKMVNNTFGIAPSTIRSVKSCAQ